MAETGRAIVTTSPRGAVTIELEHTPTLTLCPRCEQIVAADWVLRERYLVCFKCGHVVLVTPDVVLQ
jgi:DNA-directed RNA polymerase subunit RPC12/RpoP